MRSPGESAHLILESFRTCSKSSGQMLPNVSICQPGLQFDLSNLKNRSHTLGEEDKARTAVWAGLEWIGSHAFSAGAWRMFLSHTIVFMQKPAKEMHTCDVCWSRCLRVEGIERGEKGKDIVCYGASFPDHGD